MVEELKFRTHSLKLDNRATMFVGKQNIAPRIDKFVIIGGRDMETELYVKYKIDKLDVESRVIKKTPFLQDIVDKVLG